MIRNLLIGGILALGVGSVTAYAFLNKDVDESGIESTGDAPVEHEDHYHYLIGKVKFEPVNEPLAISEIQTKYIMYKTNKITFEEQQQAVGELLTKVTHFPFKAVPNYLFSVGFDDMSGVQFYFLGDTTETRTVIYRVDVGKKENKVSVIHDGQFFKLVVPMEETTKTLEAYNNEDELTLIEVD